MLRGRRGDLLGTYLVDITAMLMAMPVVLFPALAQDVFRHPELLGLLYTAYGVAIALAGLAPSFGTAVVCLAVAGAADMVSGIFRATIWNQTIPDRMRGRLAGIEMLSYSLGPIGGQVRAGIVADAWSVRGGR